MGGLLTCALLLGLPKVSYAVTGCTNTYLLGTYTAEVSSTNFLNVLNSVNTPAATTGTGGSGSTGTAATGSTAIVGFVNNPASLSGASPGTSRFYFDGNGNIVGSNALAGTYNVNSDCTGTVKLATGATFNTVVAANGGRVLFMQTNAGAGAVVGTLQRSTNTCVAYQPQSFGFSFFGAQQASASSTTGSGGTGSTGGTGTGASTTNAVSFVPYSALGVLTLNGTGQFTMSEWVSQNNTTSTVTASGNYTLGGDCSLVLTFTSPGAATVRGSWVNGMSGLLVVQPDALSTITGTFVSQ
jgi:hypothetical protein